MAGEAFNKKVPVKGGPAAERNNRRNEMREVNNEYRNARRSSNQDFRSNMKEARASGASREELRAMRGDHRANKQQMREEQIRRKADIRSGNPQTTTKPGPKPETGGYFPSMKQPGGSMERKY